MSASRDSKGTPDNSKEEPEEKKGYSPGMFAPPSPPEPTFDLTLRLMSGGTLEVKNVTAGTNFDAIKADLARQLNITASEAELLHHSMAEIFDRTHIIIAPHDGRAQRVTDNATQLRDIGVTEDNFEHPLYLQKAGPALTPNSSNR